MRSLTADQLYALRNPELELQQVVTLDTGSGTQGYATQPTSWSGETFEPLLLAAPSVSVTPGDPSRGAIGGVRVSLRLANADGRFSAMPASWYQGQALTIRDVLPSVSSDALRTLACVATDGGLVSPDVFEVRGEDWFSIARRQLWPSDSFTITQSAFPGLTPDDPGGEGLDAAESPLIGSIIPFQIGGCLHATRYVVDARRTQEHGAVPNSTFMDFHHFVGGWYGDGGDGQTPLVFFAPNGGWSSVASCRQPSETLQIGSTGVFGRMHYVRFGTPILGAPFFVRNPGKRYSFFVKGGPGTGQADYWRPTELAHLMLVNTPFGMMPLSRVDSADILATNLIERDVDLHQMRGSIQTQQPLEDWLSYVSHDGALGIVSDGQQLRLESISASRAAVSSFHVGNIVAGSLRFRDESAATLANHRKIRYARAGLDVAPDTAFAEFNVGSGATQERQAFFLRDKRSAQWTAEFYAKRETPRTFSWDTTLSPESAPLEQFDLVTVAHPLLTGTTTCEVIESAWDGVRVSITAREVAPGAFTFTSSIASDVNFGVQTEFIRFNSLHVTTPATPIGSWALSGSGDTFTYTHSVVSAPTHIKQFLYQPFDEWIASSLVTATDSTVAIFVANSLPWAGGGVAWPSFQLTMQGWQVDVY